MNRDGAQAWLNSRRVQGALALVATLVLWALLTPWATTRDLEVRVRVENADAAWRLEWEPALAAPRNGHWIDLSERLKQLGPLLSTGADPLVVRVRLANYRVERVRLGWDNSPGAKLTIEDVLVDDNIFFARRLRRVHLRPLSVEGGEQVGDAFPITVLCTDKAGGVFFDCPPPTRWGTLLAGAFAAAAVAGAWVALALLWRLVGAYDWWLTARPLPRGSEGRAQPWLTAIALTIIVGVPLWMISWAPMMISGDSTAYILHAMLLLKTGKFDHFDGWRLPGFAVTIVPFMAAVRDYAAGVGCAHALMAVLASLMAWDIARRRLPRPWPALAAILVAIDPALLIWQRAVLSEFQTAFLIMACAWLLVLIGAALGDRADPRARAPTRPGRTLALSIALGVVLAAACYTRANLQIAAVLLPCLVWLVARRAGRPALAPAAACLITAAALLAPIFVFNARNFQKVTLAVGSDWSRVLWAWEDSALDWNQSGRFTFEQFKEIRARSAWDRLSSWQFTDLYQEWETPPVPPGLNPWTQRDVRSRPFWKEAAARRGPRILLCMVKGTAALLGFPISEPFYCKNGTHVVVGPVLAHPSSSPDGTNWLDSITRFPPDVQALFDRTRHPIENVSASWQARGLAAWFAAADFVRPGLACLLLLASLRLMRRGDWACAGLAVVILAHAAALAVLLFTGDERYGMPWYGLMTVLVMIGLLWRGPAARPAH